MTLHNILQQCKYMHSNITTRTFVIVRADQFREKFIIRMNTLFNMTQTDLVTLLYTKHYKEARMAM